MKVLCSRGRGDTRSLLHMVCPMLVPFCCSSLNAGLNPPEGIYILRFQTLYHFWSELITFTWLCLHLAAKTLSQCLGALGDLGSDLPVLSWVCHHQWHEKIIVTTAIISHLFSLIWGRDGICYKYSLWELRKQKLREVKCFPQVHTVSPEF